MVRKNLHKQRHQEPHELCGSCVIFYRIRTSVGIGILDGFLQSYRKP